MFALDLIVGGTTTSLSDGNPYRLSGATGLGLPPVRRFERNYPLQDGVDDLGYVLEPRAITLTLHFYATTLSALDTHRDALTRLFVPGSNTPLTLQVTRFDGEQRRLDVVATALEITADIADRAGRLHKAVVQLRAANPLWYSPAAGTVSFAAGDVATWYLANSQIGTAAVLQQGTALGSATAWSFSGGSIDTGVSIAVRATPGTAVDLWRGSTALYDGVRHVATLRCTNGGLTFILWRNDRPIEGLFMTGTVILPSTFSAVVTLTPTQMAMWVNGTLDPYAVKPAPADANYLKLVDSLSSWNVQIPTNPVPLTGTVSHGAVYNTALGSAQIANLTQTMGGTFAALAQGATVPYDGDYHDYPVINLTGPYNLPLVTNIVNSQQIRINGSIPAGVTYTIDLRQDAISVVDQGGTIHTNKVTSDSDLAEWALVPGTANQVWVTASSFGTASSAQLVYRNRYVSY